MSNNRTIQLAEIPIGGKGGFIWNQLHGEREEICETLVKVSGPDSDVYSELLQARLQKIDDALDRLMSGSYGHCSQCDRAINEIKLDTDPATSLCLDCSGIKPFTTTLRQTPYLREPSEGFVKGSTASSYEHAVG